MSSKVHCLKRIGENVKKYKLIMLEDKNEVTIGRNPDVTMCILSTMISRCHAVLKKTASGAWTIRDNKSLNGVFVNNTKLEPMAAHELHDEDLVQLGVRASPEVEAEFQYRYYTALKVKQVRKVEDMGDNGRHTNLPNPKRVKLDNREAEVAGTSRSNIREPTSDSLVSSSQPELDMLSSPCKTQKTSKGENSPYRQYRKKIEEQESVNAAKMAEFEAKLQEMQKRLQEKESTEKDMAEQLEAEKCKRVHQSKTLECLKQKEEDLKLELIRKQELLTKEKEEMEARMKEELEDQLHVKEATLMESLENQRQALLREKKEVEEKLKQELESEREKDKKLTEDLLQQKQKLEKVIENKDAEKNLLKSQLNVTQLEKDQKQEEVLRAREDILSNFATLMETELQCSICNELFVKATSLNCSHGFCSLCIQQWMKVKKECPQCRAAITTYMRSIVLDSYIDKMVEQFSEDKKAERQTLVDERKAEEAAFIETNKPKAPVAPAPRGRGRGRGGRGRGGRGNMAAPPPLAPPLPDPPEAIGPIMVSDTEESFQEISDDDDDSDLSDIHSDGSVSVSGDDDDPYYGGYGRCYTCGNRGHWANNCPL